MTRIAPSVATAIQSVLITTDLSKVSDKPLRHALAIARHYRAKLYLLNVVSSVGYTIAGPPALQMATEATTREVAKLERDLVAAGSLEGMSHEFLVREGNIWTQVEGVIREKEVGLVVTGTHGRGSLGKMLLGSVAEQIFRRADRPVLTVGPGSAVESPIENSGGMGTFLFATDFGEASLGAL
ncbi:MAG: universal stress protein, partial [Candidatus Acidiferrum sp.]